MGSTSACNAQNLVPNGSFEMSSSCPTNPADFGLMTGWSRPTNHLGNADYYDVCGSGFVTVPSNYTGTQTPRTGNAYAGMILYFPILFNYREYLTTQLSSPMVAGRTYCVSFWVNLADTSAYTTDNGLGIHFSNTPAVSPTTTGNPLPVTPQLEVNQPITDVVGWNEMRFNYVATGGEQYLTIGNFRFDSGTNATLYNPAMNWWDDLLYVLIDDIAVEELPDASWTAPLTLCSTDAPVDLSTTITGSTGGTFTGTGITGSTFDPSAGSQSIQYAVGSTSCADTLTQMINVTPCALPVEFGEFTGSPANEGIALNWNTLSEINSSHFIVERSNGGSFEFLTQLDAQGTTQSETHYNYLDTRPSNGTNYYRLTGVDLDGSISHTETIAVDWNLERMLVFPNPAESYVTISTTNEKSKIIRLISTEGKIVRSTTTNQKEITWDILDLPSGVYQISIQSTDGSYHQRFVKRS